MNICIVGMGIIGGSYAKALKKYTDHFVIGLNRSEEPLLEAFRCNAIDEIGTPQSLKNADVVILCVYPQAAIDFIEKNGEYISKDAIVVDTAGIKSLICPQLDKLSKKFGFKFVGGHPMAGKEKNGFSASDADLFCGASFLLVECGADNKSVDTIADLMLSLGFGGIKKTTPQEHDRMIAYTSQLPHVLACSYVMSPCCLNHRGFSAGSYRDVSRVANINATLWSELFLENKEPLCEELEILIQNINSIKNAIESEDKERLIKLLDRSRKVKEALGE